VLETIPPVVYALGFSWRKRTLVRQFLAPSKVVFVHKSTEIPDGATTAVWASGPFAKRDEVDTLKERFKQLLVEDGFLRSVGLGADLARPLSWVIDSRGIYYDASRPSDLEHLLQVKTFDDATLQRARDLREKLVSTGLTKYNVGTLKWQRPEHATHLDVVLVPGQVESDASLRYGAPGISTNLELLKAARIAHPEAWLIYKPHPDVVAGLRDMGENEDHAYRWCNEVVRDVSMGALLESVDIVHVLTSLSGFEALLRGKVVVCHGMPFYAGWGLTKDVLSCHRRKNKLTMDQLVAGVLLEYPTYVSRANGSVCQVEQAFDELLVWRSRSNRDLPFWRKMVRPLIRRK
jgi:capsular polysaccharide export protein